MSFTEKSIPIHQSLTDGRKGNTVVTSPRAAIQSSDPLYGNSALPDQTRLYCTVTLLHWYHLRLLSWENISLHIVLAFLTYDTHKHWDMTLYFQNSSKSSTWIVLGLEEWPQSPPCSSFRDWKHILTCFGSTTFDTIQCWALTVFIRRNSLYTDTRQSWGKREVELKDLNGLNRLNTRNRNCYVR